MGDVRNRHPIVLIEWLDSACVTGWKTYPCDGFGISECATAGFLIYEDDVQAQIAQSVTAEGHYGNVISIPAASIVNKTALKKE